MTAMHQPATNTRRCYEPRLRSNTYDVNLVKRHDVNSAINSDDVLGRVRIDEWREDRERKQRDGTDVEKVCTIHVF